MLPLPSVLTNRPTSFIVVVLPRNRIGSISQRPSSPTRGRMLEVCSCYARGRATISGTVDLGSHNARWGRPLSSTYKQHAGDVRGLADVTWSGLTVQQCGDTAPVGRPTHWSRSVRTSATSASWSRSPTFRPCPLPSLPVVPTRRVLRPRACPRLLGRVVHRDGQLPVRAEVPGEEIPGPAGLGMRSEPR